MKYRNADDVFPKELMIEIRKFIPEGYVYISTSKDRKPWGSILWTKVRIRRKKSSNIQRIQVR